MPNAFWISISIIPVSKPSSNPFNILCGKCDKHRFAEWFGLNPDWKLYKILFSEKICSFDNGLSFQSPSKLLEVKK